MSIFKCKKCGCAENTALCGYNFRGDGPALCSECDPKIGKWHGHFTKKIYQEQKKEQTKEHKQIVEGLTLLFDGMTTIIQNQKQIINGIIVLAKKEGMEVTFKNNDNKIKFEGEDE